MSEHNKQSRGPLVTLFLTVFLDLVGFSIIFPLYPAMLQYYFARERDGGLLFGLLDLLGRLTPVADAGGDFLVTVLFGGVLGSLYALLQFVSAPLLGRLSDRHGRRPLLMATIAGNVVGYGLWIVSGSFALLLASRIVNGVMSGNLSVASAAIADSTSRDNRAKGMALIGVAFGLGFLVGPAIGGATAAINLLDHFPGLASVGINPFSTPALCACLLSLFNLVRVARGLPETLHDRNRAPTRGHIFSRLLTIEHRGIRLTTLVNLLFIIGFSGMEFSLTFLVTERLSYGPRDNIWIFVHLGVVLILTQGLLVRKLAGPLGERRLTLAGLALGVVAFAALAFGHTAPQIYLGLGIMALGAGMVHPSLSALVSLYSTAEDQGRDLGLFRAAGSLARGAGPLLAAAVYWQFGSGRAYLLGAALTALPLLVALRLPDPKRDTPCSPPRPANYQ